MQKSSSRFLLASVCLFLAAMVLLGNAGTAVANVPTILQIENISQGSAGRIRLQIWHLPPPDIGSSHYVDTVEVQIAGVTKQFDLQPQSSEQFTVELDLGEVQGTPDVRARAHCNLHGWSDWSQTVPVPEFPTMAIVASTLLLTMAVFIVSNTAREKREWRNQLVRYQARVRCVLS